MRRCAAAFKQASSPEDKRPGTYGRDVLCRARLPSNKLDRLLVAERINNALVSPWDADQIEIRTILKRVRRQEAETTITRHGVLGFGDDVHRRVGQSRQHLLGPGEVELRQVGEDDEADTEERHLGPPAQS